MDVGETHLNTRVTAIMRLLSYSPKIRHARLVEARAGRVVKAQFIIFCVMEIVLWSQEWTDSRKSGQLYNSYK